VSTFTILLPIFALIFAGYLCRRRRLMGATAASELNRFVVWLALPALLFDIVAKATWTVMYQPAFIAAFSLACGAVFALVLAHRLFRGRPLADASVEAIAASYPNTGYIGFPLGLLIFGNASLVPTTIASIVVACVLFGIAIALIEIGLQKEQAAHQLAAKVVLSLAKNPLIVAPIVGAIVAVSGVPIPPGVETFLKLLGGAASPCALVSLGLFLAEKRTGENGVQDDSQVVARGLPVALTLAKLVVQPGLTWWLAVRVFALPANLTQMAVLLAALPTGTGPFMLAEFYRREAHIISRTILFSTIASLATLSAIMAWMRMGD
jgi:malonate transporter and related proteins